MYTTSHTLQTREETQARDVNTEHNEGGGANANRQSDRDALNTRQYGETQ
jgi:hypothetical protein